MSIGVFKRLGEGLVLGMCVIALTIVVIDYVCVIILGCALRSQFDDRSSSAKCREGAVVSWALLRD